MEAALVAASIFRTVCQRMLGLGMRQCAAAATATGYPLAWALVIIALPIIFILHNF